MRNSELQRRWKKSGATYAGIGASIGVTKQTIRDAVLGNTKRPQPKVAAAIAAVIGVSADEAFPHTSKVEAATARAASAVAELTDAPVAA